MEYEITIKTREAYAETKDRYEGNDGINYSSSYSIPTDVKYKKVLYETGAIEYNEKVILTQIIESIDLAGVIKAINKI